MTENVGQVSLDLVLNSKEFESKLNNAVNKATNNINGKMNKGLGNTGALLGKIGKLTAGAFAIGTIVRFSKECVNLGSNLAEVQNVVDSTFTTMSEKVDEFAQTSITRLGMSETTYKKMVGTLGAMSKSFNFTEAEALKMADSITSLTADVASFYNLSHDEAYTKMKSIYTGETESLKELGVVMTQTALDEFALANGFGKTTKAMTEQEKVALRYNFVMKQLQTASGDFQRTSNGWANQTRILSENFNKLKASIGQGLINVLLPVIRVLNTLMVKLQVLGDMFSNFTAKIFGKAETSTSAVTSTLTGLGDVASSTSDAIGGVADSTAEAVKKMNKTTFGFDDLNTLQAPTDTSTGGGGADVGGIGDSLTSATTQQEKLSEKTSVYETILDKLIKKAKELANIFKTGFNLGLDSSGFTTAIDGIKGSISSIKNSFMNIFGDGQVLGAFNGLINSVTYAIGSLVGNIVGIGASIVNGLVGSVAQYLDANSVFIKEKLISMFDITSEISMTFSNIFNDLGEIISNFFNSDLFKSFGSNVLSILINPFLIAQELLLNIFNDLLSGISLIISENKNRIQQTLEGLLSFINGLTKNLSDLIDYIGEKVTEVYNTYIKPSYQNISEGFSSLVSTILDLWNSYVQPVLDRWGTKITALFNNHIKPFVDSFMTGIGKIMNVVSKLWKEVLQPVISWVLSIITPILMPLIETLGNFVIDWVANIFDSFVWLWDKLVWLVEGVGKLIILIKDILVGLFNVIKTVITTIANFVSSAVDTIKTKALNGFNSIKEGASNIFNGLKNIITTVFGGLVNIIKTPINAIIGIVNKAINSINGLSIDVPDWVPGIGGSTYGFNLPNIPMLADGGYVTAPTLAMVGEGKENEIVSPESKMREIENEGANSTNILLNQMIEQNKQLINIMTMLLNKDSDVYLDRDKVGAMLTNYQISENRRRG